MRALFLVTTLPFLFACGSGSDGTCIEQALSESNIREEWQEGLEAPSSHGTLTCTAEDATHEQAFEARCFNDSHDETMTLTFSSSSFVADERVSLVYDIQGGDRLYVDFPAPGCEDT